MSREREVLRKLRGYVHWVSLGKATLLSKDKEMLNAIDAILSQPEAEPRYTPHGTGTVPPGPVVQQPAPMAITLYSTEPAPQQTVCMNANCDKPKICATMGRCCAVKNQHVAESALQNFVDAQKPLPPEFRKVLDDNYWELLTGNDPDQHADSLAAVARHKGETPETEKRKIALRLHYSCATSKTDFSWIPSTKEGLLIDWAEELERQRDELRAENERLRAQIAGIK